MYGLPNDVDLSFLTGRELISIHFATHSVIFHFDDEVSLTAGSAIFICDGGSDGPVTKRYGEVAAQLLTLLDRQVTSACGTGDGTLRLVFAGSVGFGVVDDSSCYESYTLNHRGGIVVV